MLYVDPNGLARVKEWEIGKYVIKLFSGNLVHGGPHYHVYLKKGVDSVARIGMEGEVLACEVSQSLMEKMVPKGLITSVGVGLTGIAMFFDAAPAGAQDDRLMMAGVSGDARGRPVSLAPIMLVDNAIVAAELAGHVVPGIQGRGAAVSDEDEHHAREDPATEAARRNREQASSPPQ